MGVHQRPSSSVWGQAAVSATSPAARGFFCRGRGLGGLWPAAGLCPARKLCGGGARPSGLPPFSGVAAARRPGRKTATLRSMIDLAVAVLAARMVTGWTSARGGGCGEGLRPRAQPSMGIGARQADPVAFALGRQHEVAGCQYGACGDSQQTTTHGEAGRNAAGRITTPSRVSLPPVFRRSPAMLPTAPLQADQEGLSLRRHHQRLWAGLADGPLCSRD